MVFNKSWLIELYLYSFLNLVNLKLAVQRLLLLYTEIKFNLNCFFALKLCFSVFDSTSF